MKIVIYTKANCPNCVSAKSLLDSKGLEYEERDFEAMKDSMREAFMREFQEARQMPQIFINGQRVGGLAGLQAALKQVGVV